MNERLSQPTEHFHIQHLLGEHAAPTLKIFTASTAFSSCYLPRPNFNVFPIGFQWIQEE